jgi:small conductance mechanosensitive channel
MGELTELLNQQSAPVRVLGLIVIALVVHGVVIVVRQIAEHATTGARFRTQKKVRSLITLASSAMVFALYFFVLGLILQEMNVSLTAYLASASVIGLAVAFGSQGIVQDVVMGVTIIFSDLLDVGDLVEIAGQTGKVKKITMRYVQLENALGAEVFIPNRTINNVVNYPRGYIRCLVDVTLLGSPVQKEAMEKLAVADMRGLYEQFPGILLTEPSVEGREQYSNDKEILRIKFRIWPGRGQPIETTFVKNLVADLKTLNAEYQDWMVAVFYEVEKQTRRNPRR